jgi:hypothetical protein
MLGDERACWLIEPHRLLFFPIVVVVEARRRFPAKAWNNPIPTKGCEKNEYAPLIDTLQENMR